MQSVYTLKSKMVDDLVEHLINPLQKFLRDDAKQMKETGKNFDKMMEKFDNAYTKYCALSKLKEPSALKEDEYQLFEIKKGYVRSSLDYTFKISQFKQKMELTVVEKFLSALHTQSDFYAASDVIYKGFAPEIIDVKKKLDKGNELLESSGTAESAKKKTLEDASIKQAKPGFTKRCVTCLIWL
jgi:hypothetical protein